MKKEKSPTAIFATSFVISLAALLIVMLLSLSATVLAPDRLTTLVSSNREEDRSLDQYRPSTVEAFSMLLIHCRERSELPFSYTLLHFDPVGHQILLVSIPPETQVTIGGRTDTMNGQYQYAGSDNARIGAENLLCISVPCYARMNQNGSINLIDALGGMEIALTTPYTNDFLTLPAGQHLLNGKQLLKLKETMPNILFSSESELLRKLLEQRLTAAISGQLDYWFTVFCNNTDTNVTQIGYAERKNAFRYFLNHPERQVKRRELDGTWAADRSVFYPDATAVEKLRQEMNHQ